MFSCRAVPPRRRWSWTVCRVGGSSWSSSSKSSPLQRSDGAFLPEQYLPLLIITSLLGIDASWQSSVFVCAECAGESGPGGEGQSPAATNRARCQRAGAKGLCQTLSNPSGKKEKNTCRWMISKSLWQFIAKCATCYATQISSIARLHIRYVNIQIGIEQNRPRPVPLLILLINPIPKNSQVVFHRRSTSTQSFTPKWTFLFYFFNKVSARVVLLAATIFNIKAPDGGTWICSRIVSNPSREPVKNSTLLQFYSMWRQQMF